MTATREMMVAELRFFLSGSLIGVVHADVVPSPGAEVTFTTSNYKKGLVPGSVISFIVEGDTCEPTSFDYSRSETVAHIDVNSYTLIKAGPALEE